MNGLIPWETMKAKNLKYANTSESVQKWALLLYLYTNIQRKGGPYMAVFRVERTKGFTVMSNYHLNDKTISLKSKGLLSQMLSLPESWDFTLRGLACINKESLDAIRTAVLELEEHGYITRRQRRGENGKLAKIEYTIYEQPQQMQSLSPRLDKPCLENPNTVNPNTVLPNTGSPTQLNTKEIITEKSITEPETIHQ